MNTNLHSIEEKQTLQSKKKVILSLFRSGVTEVETIAAISGAKPSYVGSVLQAQGLIDNYFDLYTSTGHAMNIYSKQFRGKLGFKNAEVAKRSVAVLDEAYGYFENRQDRPGQHHSLDLALTMLDRARWAGKLEEAEVYRRWLVGKLSTPLVETAQPRAVAGRQTELFVEDKAELKKAA